MDGLMTYYQDYFVYNCTVKHTSLLLKIENYETIMFYEVEVKREKGRRGEREKVGI